MSSARSISRFLKPRLGSPSSALFGALAGTVILLAGWLVVGTDARSESILDLTDGSAWLTSTAFGGISLHDGSDGAAVTLLKIAEANDEFSVEQFGPDAVVVNDTTGVVSRLDAASWSVTKRVAFGSPGEDLEVVIGSAGSWIVGSGAVAPLDPESLTQNQSVPVGDAFAAGAILADGSLIYAAASNDGSARLFNPDGSSSKIEGLSGPASFALLASGIAAIDSTTGATWLENSGMVCEALDVPDGVPIVGGGDGEHLLAIADNGSVFIWQPAQGCPDASSFSQTEPGRFGQPAVTDGWGVVPDLAAGEVLVIDLLRGEIVSRVPLAGLDPGAPFDLIAESGSIWFNDPQTAAAGLIKRDGNVLELNKYENTDSGGFLVAPVDDPVDGDIRVAGLVQTPTTQLSETETSDAQPEDAQPESNGEVTTTAAAQQPSVTADSAQGGSTTENATAESPEDGSAPDAGTPEDQAALPEIDLDPAGPEDSQPARDVGPISPPNSGLDEQITQPTSPPEEPPAEEDSESEAAAIRVQIAQSATEAVVGEAIVFQAVVASGNPTSFEWLINPSPGGPSEGNGAEIEKRFNREGKYSISLVACGDSGECAQATRSMRIVAKEQQAPLLVSIQGVSEVRVGTPIQFRAGTQGEPDSITWVFPGGSPASATGEVASTTFNTVGQATIKVTAERGAERVSHELKVNVRPQSSEPLAFNVRCSDSSLEEGSSAQCWVENYSAAAFSGLSWSVSAPSQPALGGISLANGRRSVSYDGIGTVTVSASATDTASGDSVQDSASITFTAKPTQTLAPDPSISGPSSVEVGESATFSLNNSGGPIDSQSWSASGTSANSSASSATMQWATAGTYTVTVNVSGPGGDRSAQRQVTVEAAPVDEEDLAITRAAASNTGPGQIRVDVDVNKCASMDYVWSGGYLPPGSCAATHSQIIDGLTPGERYTISLTARTSSGERAFGSVAVTVGGDDTENNNDGGEGTTLTVTAKGARAITQNSAELYFSVNLCSESSWSGNAVNKSNVGGGQCWFDHAHQNPAWGGSLPLSPGQTYTVNVTFYSADGQTASASVTFSTLAADTPTTPPPTDPPPTDPPTTPPPTGAPTTPPPTGAPTTPPPTGAPTTPPPATDPPPTVPLPTIPLPTISVPGPTLPPPGP